MKKMICLILAFFILAGCTTSSAPQESEPLKILAPSGAPALSVAHLIGNDSSDVTVVEGSDVLQAAFVNPDPEFDVLVAPTNLGVKLIQAKNSPYRLAAVVTWGNLYVVAESESVFESDALQFAAFGELAVPGLVFNSVSDQLNLQNVTYYNAVSEAQAALLSGNAQAALLAEPAASATINKAKQQGKELQVVYDVQSLWQNKTGSHGYPQAAVFVRVGEDNEQQIDEFLQQIEHQLKSYESDKDSLKSVIEAAGAENLGLPSAELAMAAYDRMGLSFSYASKCSEQLSEFLSLFDIQYDSSFAIR